VIRGVDFVFQFARNCARFQIDFPGDGKNILRLISSYKPSV